jgi:hypothetical protein
MAGDAISFFNWIKGCPDGIEKSYDRHATPSIVWIGVTRASMKAHHRYLGGKIEWYEERIEKIRKQRGAGIDSRPFTGLCSSSPDENETSLDDSGPLDNPSESRVEAHGAEGSPSQGQRHRGVRRAGCDSGSRWTPRLPRRSRGAS